MTPAVSRAAGPPEANGPSTEEPRIEVHSGTGGTAPLVFLHGFLGRPAMWGEVRRFLGSAGNTALLELPGHGPQPYLPQGSTFVTIVDAIAAALPFASPWLVGYSMGARIALDLALRHPGRISGAVLIGVDPGLRDPAERAERASWDEAQAVRLESEGLAAFVDAWERLPLFATQTALEPERLLEQRASRLAHTAPGLAWAMRVLGLGRMPSHWERLPGAEVPLHLLCGAHDPKFSALASEVAATTPRASVEVVPSAGHNLALEAPASVAAAIRLLTVESETAREA